MKAELDSSIAQRPIQKNNDFAGFFLLVLYFGQREKLEFLKKKSSAI